MMEISSIKFEFEFLTFHDSKQNKNKYFFKEIFVKTNSGFKRICEDV